MLWPRFLRRSGTSPRLRGLTAPSVRPWVEELETRNLPSVTAAFGAGVLTLTGTGNDAIEVRNVSGSLVVIANGKIIDTLASNTVTNLAVTTGVGNNVVRIDNNVTQTATVTATGNGSNTFYGGDGLTALTGGGGPNRLVAGAGVTTLTGGAGINQLLGGTGVDTFVAGTGPTLDYNVKVGDTQTGTPEATVVNAPPPKAIQNLTTSDVSTILDRAAAATPSDDAIVAIVDRTGNILGIRVEGNVSQEITTNPEKLVFAIDGAVAEARAAALFSNNQAPLTSRTIQDLSESTITEQEVDSDPNLNQGPGFVAPVEIGAHFPANVPSTPQVDLFDIQATNRDSINFSVNGISDPALGGTIIQLMNRFNVGGTAGGVTTQLNTTNVVGANPGTNTGSNFAAPESYGYNAYLVGDPSNLHYAQARGIGTLPGGDPLFKNGQLVGGIGVFFPGTTGYASAENSSLSSTYNPALPDRSLEAEFIAFFAAGGSSAGGASFAKAIGNAPAAPAGFDLPNGRIDLAGITLDIYGPGGVQGIGNTVAVGERLGIGKGNANSNAPNALNNFGVGDPNQIVNAGTGVQEMNGVQPAAGYISNPVAGVPNHGQQLTASDVTQIVNQALAQAAQTQAAIRTPAGQPAQFVIAISDLDGNIIGLYRESDATVFSESVAVAKARNVGYYADTDELQAIDQISGIPAGVAFTSRTFRYLGRSALPRRHRRRSSGTDVDPQGRRRRSDHGLADRAHQDAAAVYECPGPQRLRPRQQFPPRRGRPRRGQPERRRFLPRRRAVVQERRPGGGLGVSGDGVNQDDLVTALAAAGFNTPANLRVDNYSYQNVRLPYQKFGRNPEGN